MKFALFFIVLFFSSQDLFAQNKHFIAKEVEPGKCYASAILANNGDPIHQAKNDRWLYIQKSIWEPYEDTLYLDLPQEDWDRDHFEMLTKRVMIREPSLEWLKHKVDRHCISADLNYVISFCLVEKPGEYKTINYLMPKDSSYQKTVLDTLILQKYKLQEYGSIYEVDSPDTNQVKWVHHNEYVANEIKDDYYVYLQKGNWTAYREVVCGTRCGGGIDVRKINARLKELGYDVNEGNVIDKKTKAALTHYIKKNGLHVHALTHDLLKSLGIE